MAPCNPTCRIQLLQCNTISGAVFTFRRMAAIVLRRLYPVISDADLEEVYTDLSNLLPVIYDLLKMTGEARTQPIIFSIFVHYCP